MSVVGIVQLEGFIGNVDLFRMDLSGFFDCSDLISVGKTRHRLATMKYLFVVFDMYAGTCFVYPRLFGSHLSMNLLCWDIRLTEFRSSSNLRGFMFVTGLG